MGLFRAIRESQLVVMFLTMLWFFVVCQYFIPLIIMLPIGLIPKVGVTWYRKASGWWDSWSRVAVMCIPFSWCMPPLHLVNSSVVTTLKSKGNALLLSTHCSRVDWLMGVYMGTLHRQWGQTLAQDPWARIGFVAEMTIGLMPVIGWARVLFGDILVARAFHHDRPRIEKNINEFHKSGITRMLFLAPEGFIADPGSEIGEKYINDCEEFMKSMGREPLTHVLTPRYKGMQAFVKHAPGNVASCAMSFVEGHPTVDPDTGVVHGGRLETKALRSAERTIPDLHSVFKGGLTCFVKIHHLPIEAGGGDAGTAKMKEQLVADQIEKDGWLRHFDEHRKYPGVVGGAIHGEKWGYWTKIKTPHFTMNAVMLVQLAAYLYVTCKLTGLTLTVVCQRIGIFLAVILSIHFMTHWIARTTTGCASRESLVGETAVKALLDLFSGVVSLLKRLKGKKGVRHSRSARELADMKGNGKED